MRVSVIIPALNEESTVAEVVAAVLDDAPLEVIVIDADSTDGTAREAAAAGATVLNWREVLPDIPTRPGKGESLWRGVAAAEGDIVVFVDADLHRPAPGMIQALAAPFFDEEIHLVKADYRRTFHGEPTGGGRVTELTAKPLIRAFFPELSHINQPLAGEYALRRATALDLPFTAGYGVEAGLLVDIARLHGPASITQVDLGVRRHRNRPLAELAPMADIVMATFLDRVGVTSGAVSVDVGKRPPLSGIL